MSYKPRNSHFAGFIFFTSLEGNYINGWQYENGEVIRKGRSSSGLVNGKVPAPGDDPGEGGDNCLVVVTDWYERDCNIYWDDHMECTEWMYIGTTYQTYCYGSGGGSGGGGGGGGVVEDPVCDQSARDEAIQEYNDYVAMAAPTFVNKDASVTNARIDPITGSFTWTVAEAQFGSWKILSDCNFKYYHTRVINIYSGWEDEFDLFYFKSGNGYFVGSNILIKSTYTTTTPTTNEVVNNKTKNTMGISVVKGKLEHVMDLKIRMPYCDPITLNTVDPIDNQMIFHPK